ncbi:MAG: PAS domain S-box protein [Phenylobacterium sp.]|nr:MAG: PAS domain S-box protein [Phenylobacterium sp.]
MLLKGQGLYRSPPTSGALPLLTHWIGDGRPRSKAVALAAGAAGAASSIALGLLLKAQTGGGEPLMAVFPILLVVCLGWGAIAGWVSLIAGVVGAWYFYLGRQFSFVVGEEDVRALAVALVVGVLIIGVCLLLRSCIVSLQASNAASLLLATGLADRGRELDNLNAELTLALSDKSSAVEALSLTEAQFRTSFEAAAVGKVQAEPHTGRIIRANRAFAEMLGYEPQELEGRDGWEFTPVEDRAEESAAYRLVLEGRQAVYLREKRYLRRDGTTIWGRVSATITRSPQSGAPLLAIAVIENIDHRYKAEAELVAAKAELEGILADRDATILQRNLLLREVYHRVKNNLQIIDGLLIMQGRRIADPDAKAAIASLRGRIYALGLVHQQLMGSHDLETFDIAPFLNDLSANILEGGAARNVVLSVRAPPLSVGLDFALPLGLIVTELITNSLKHAFPSGQGNLEVILERLADGAIVLVVADDGRHVEAKDTADGTGSLGMTIITGLAKQLGGKLTINTSQGTRSELRIAAPSLT